MTAPHAPVQEGSQRHSAARAALESLLVVMQAAGPFERIELERRGVQAKVVRGLVDYLGVPADRLLLMLGHERSEALPRRLSGSLGYAVLRLVHIVSIARNRMAASTDPDATSSELGKWLGSWLQQPIPALAGRCPADLIDTPTGSELVERVLGSIASGAYR